jgi:mono/diheme cytochrome c family protein
MAQAALLGLLTLSAASAAEPVLEMTVGGVAKQWTRSQLLRDPALQNVTVSADVAYQRPMRYQAVPLTALTGPLRASDSLQFTALDGFVANIPAALLAGPAQPMVAVENPDAPWPPLKPGGPSAGPFYLVWLSPAKDGVSPEQWPYQIARIAAAAPLTARYPQLRPQGGGDGAQRGLQVYVANCAACHKLDGGGDAAIGPDLNRPFNPTEYFREPFLRRLIRDPSSVRNWERRTMPGFSAAALSDAQLDDLLAYLRQMAKQR